MRGKAPTTVQIVSFIGITPAYAGKRLTLYKIWQTVRDHPRLCGEKNPLTFLANWILGSPPPMRGKALRRRYRHSSGRITPAYAGKRHRRQRQSEKNWGSPPPMRGKVQLRLRRLSKQRDHPRLCGEKIWNKTKSIAKEGSPPPMRGKAFRTAPWTFSTGITPAYAGKSSCHKKEARGSRDHPRLCGEKTKKIPKQRYFFHQPASFSFSLQYT